MPPPPARVAVTVAPPIGTLAVFVTIPTIVPYATAIGGVEESSARTIGAPTAIDMMAAARTLPRYFPMFMFVARNEQVSPISPLKRPSLNSGAACANNGPKASSAYSNRNCVKSRLLTVISLKMPGA